MFKVLTTEEFDKDFNKLDKSIKQQIEKEIDQLKKDPYVGKPLGYKFFREKKVQNYRFNYLIFEEYVLVFIIAISDKKNQQETIDIIKRLIPSYREKIKKRFNFD